MSSGQQALIQDARTVARDVLAPLAAKSEARVNRELVAALGRTGLLRRLFPRSFGGLQAGSVSALELCLLRESLARESTAAETALALQGLGAYPIVQAGTEEAARRYVPSIAAGRAVASFALTEPGAGSDAAALSLQAEPDGDGYRLTGEKAFISNAPDADLYTVFARTSPGGSRGVTAYVVEGDALGLSGEPIELLSPHPIGRLTFDGVPVSRRAMLGEEGAGFKVAMRTLDLFRPSVGAFAVGMAQAALDEALRHTSVRKAFGRPLKDFQAVSHPLADVAVRIEASRLLVYAAASTYDSGRAVTKMAAMAKLYATETAQQAVDVAVQVVGARALERGHLLEHLYRDVRAPRIYEGTSEIQREIIARQLYRDARIPPNVP
ncbi:MAG TPA: acyl-CoA dehydrogenase family protein [Actinomycetota bacterium]|nr:acyl-CoA dehydrogenase family protein [Actinomycetota bacterium]